MVSTLEPNQPSERTGFKGCNNFAFKSRRYFAVYSTKEKLKPEYAGKAGLEIRDLKRAGVEVTVGGCVHAECSCDP